MAHRERHLEEFTLLPISESAEQVKVVKPPMRLSWYPKDLCLISLLIGLPVLLYLALALGPHFIFYGNTGHFDDEAAFNCINPPFRREWRNLTRFEQDDYVTAVQCLRTIPSRLLPNRSLYDDFPWVHSRIGSSYHGTAGFLAWHRYFIHFYETALRESCGYEGFLTYWDWVLDSEDISKSPIWDSKTGFGGDGNVNSPTTVGHGHCVVDGPFADVVALFYGLDDDHVHCLSRGLRRGESLKHLCTSPIGPDAIETVLRSSDYELFNLGLEHGPHRAIPDCIRGDWYKFSVPYGTFSIKVAPVKRRQREQRRGLRSRQILFSSSTTHKSIDFGLYGSSKTLKRDSRSFMEKLGVVQMTTHH